MVARLIHSNAEAVLGFLESSGTLVDVLRMWCANQDSIFGAYTIKVTISARVARSGKECRCDYVAGGADTLATACAYIENRV